MTLLFVAPVDAAQVTRHDQTASGLQGWLIQDNNIEIQLNPLMPEQVRAFYLARGFSNKVIELIAHSCVYQTVIKNISAENNARSVSVDLSNWRLIDERGESGIESKSSWQQKWSDMGETESAIIAFQWATFPWQQDFELTGDYGWGMILLGPITGESFDLIARWKVGGTPFQQKIEQLNCPDQ